MEVFIYQADFYCSNCTAGICIALQDEGKKPQNVIDEFTYDSDDYPKGPYPDGGGGANTANYCAECGVALDNPIIEEPTQWLDDAEYDDADYDDDDDDNDDDDSPCYGDENDESEISGY